MRQELLVWRLEMGLRALIPQDSTELRREMVTAMRRRVWMPGRRRELKRSDWRLYS
jgi:hypothetical protein